MSFFRKKKKTKLATKRSTFKSYVNFPISDAMATPNTTPANPTYENLLDKSNGSALAAGESEFPPPNTYVNLPPKTDSPKESRGASLPKLSPQHSDPCINPYSNVVQIEGGEFTVTGGHPQRVDDTKLRLLMPEVECVRCKELGQLLAMWELGVSGLARNYSKILSHLNKAKDAAFVLECRVKQKTEMNSSMTASKNLGNSSRGFRQSVYGGANTEPNLAKQMYPETQEQQPTPHEKQFSDLNAHLGEAIDVCQQLAAACFKSNQSSSGYSRLRRQPTMPNMPVTSRSTPTTSPHHRSTLQSISEENPSSSRKKHRNKPPLERTPSAPSDITSSTSSTVSQDRLTATPEKKQPTEGGTERDENELILDKEELTANHDDAFVAKDIVSQKSHDSPSKSHDSPVHDSPVKSHDSPVKSHDSPTKVPFSIDQETEAVHSTDRNSTNVSDSGTGSMMDLGNRDSILSTYSESDVKQVMSKLADLEEERLKLLETKERMFHENQEVRQSLTEILADLASKDLQLTLAMQDLNIATREINKAAEMRENLAGLESEKDVLLERLGNLEDESAAVKLSLIRLLQEKSATNKTLALENWRLNQRMRHMANATLRRGSKSDATKGATPTGGAEGQGDSDSVTSGFSTNTEDATLQEAYMDFDVSGNFVHKQGFLVKQGAKVKSWKKRLFVLNTDGLSYFKTEQPIQMIPITDIGQVQVCHGSRSPYPNLFQVHTSNRVFYLSAPSEDEMQSWVGMLQTLKQYNRVATLHRDAIMKAQLQEEHLPVSLEDEVDHHQPLLQSHHPPPAREESSQDVRTTASFSDDDAALLESSESVVKSVPVTRSGFVDMEDQTDIIASLNLELP